MSGDVTISSDDLPRHMSRDPDGASNASETRPGSSNENAAENNGRKTEKKILIDSDDDEDDDQAKSKKKGMNLLSCLGSKARVSFRKKGKKKSGVQSVKLWASEVILIVIRYK